VPDTSKTVSVGFHEDGIKDLIGQLQQLSGAIAGVGAGAGAGVGGTRTPTGFVSTGPPHESQIRHHPPPYQSPLIGGGYPIGPTGSMVAPGAPAAAGGAPAAGGAGGAWVIHAQHVTVYGPVTFAGGVGGGAPGAGGAGVSPGGLPLGNSSGGGAAVGGVAAGGMFGGGGVAGGGMFGGGGVMRDPLTGRFVGGQAGGVGPVGGGGGAGGIGQGIQGIIGKLAGVTMGDVAGGATIGADIIGLVNGLKQITNAAAASYLSGGDIPAIRTITDLMKGAMGTIPGIGPLAADVMAAIGPKAELVGRFGAISHAMGTGRGGMPRGISGILGVSDIALQTQTQLAAGGYALDPNLFNEFGKMDAFLRESAANAYLRTRTGPLGYIAGRPGMNPRPVDLESAMHAAYAAGDWQTFRTLEGALHPGGRSRNAGGGPYLRGTDVGYVRGLIEDIPEFIETGQREFLQPRLQMRAAQAAAARTAGDIPGALRGLQNERMVVGGELRGTDILLATQRSIVRDATASGDKLVQYNAVRRLMDLEKLHADQEQQRSALFIESANMPLETHTRSRLSALEYQSSIMSGTPGGYGNWRGTQLSMINELNTAARQIEARRAELRTQPGYTPEADLAFQQRLQDIGLQEMQAVNQLSFGWEGRVASMLVNGRSDANLSGRGFNMRGAILGGVWNPHMGARGDTLPFALDYARWGSVPMPSRNPGQQGPFQNPGTGAFMNPFGPLPGTDPFVRDMNWGGGLPGGGGSGGGTSGGGGVNAPNAGGGDGQVGGPGAPVKVVFSGSVTLRWPDGSPAGAIGSSNMVGNVPADWRDGMGDWPWSGGMSGAAHQG